jgi:DNA repair exonuclease SbcCD ATPase subunit
MDALFWVLDSSRSSPDGTPRAQARAEREELADRAGRLRRLLADLEKQASEDAMREQDERRRTHRAAVLGASREHLVAAVESAGAGVLVAAADLEDAQQRHAEAVQRVADAEQVQELARTAAYALAAARSASYLQPSTASTAAEKQARIAAEKAGDEAERALAALPHLAAAVDRAAQQLQHAQQRAEDAQHAQQRARTALAAHDVRQSVEALRAPLEALRAHDRSAAAGLARSWARDGLRTLSEETRPEVPAWLTAGF